MSGRDILLGTRTFRKLREGNYVYVDKTGFISEFLSGAGAKVSIITRPRRFGKSLLLNMLMEFFDIRKDSRELFEGLAVSKDKDICSKWMNKYPVIYLSLNEIKTESFEESYGYFETVASKLCGQYEFLLSSPKVGKFHKIALEAVLSCTAKNVEPCMFINTLCEAIYQDCGIKPVILIDEYDAPLSKIKGEEDYKKMASFLDYFYEISLKSNDYFEFSILTGCLRFTNADITTGFNNYVSYGVNDLSFADKFGFTHEEVQSLLAEQGFSDKMDTLQEWYDGYCFGNSHPIYCPWDVMNYLYDLKESQNARPKKYWINTSGNDVVLRLLEGVTGCTADTITTLLNHAGIDAEIKENLTYKNLYDSKQNVWTLLYFTGYLTKVPNTEDETGTVLGLRIPNKEIYDFFMLTAESVFRRRVDGNDSLPLFFDAFWNRADQTVSEMLSALFTKAISFHDYGGVFCHAVLAGLFKREYPHTTSDYGNGAGMADIIVRDRANKRAAVIEIKRHSDTETPLSSSVDRALRHIADMKYDALLQGDYSVILHWGIACQDKSCVAKSVDGKREAV
ncbi:MAG: AAA family ATPase [Desulfovibrionaceae bacterium]|nr:AAA family ATPase [Desulfovibrionaceae bacterium]